MGKNSRYVPHIVNIHRFLIVSLLPPREQGSTSITGQPTLTTIFSHLLLGQLGSQTYQQAAHTNLATNRARVIDEEMLFAPLLTPITLGLGGI